MKYTFEDLQKMQRPEVKGETFVFDEGTQDWEFVSLRGKKKLKEIRFETTQENLKYLDASRCSLEKITFSASCENLQTLYLHHNNLKTVEFTTEFPELELIDLSFNEKLTELKVLTALPKLNFLYLHKCDIKSLEQFTKYFIRPGFDFNIEENENIQSPPAEIVRQGKDAVLNYFIELGESTFKVISFEDFETIANHVNIKKEDYKKDADGYYISLAESERIYHEYSQSLKFFAAKSAEFTSRYSKAIHGFDFVGFDNLFEAKLILVGEERAGKSTIARALSELDFKIDLNEESTKGIEIIKWILPKSNCNTDKDFRFNIWDFGGQEIYHATHQFFLTKRSLYLFVTEARKDLRFDDFYYWLNIINTLSGNSPIIIVQNKADQPHAEQSIEEYEKMFPQIFGGLIKVSCNTEHPEWESKYKFLVENFLKQTIYDVLCQKKLKGIGDKLPKAWVDVRASIAELQSNNHNYITLTGYFAICKEKGLNEDRALFLSDYFHDLGVFLHFRKDIQLRNIIFLNHEWVTKSIYKVFDDEKVKKSNGKFSNDDLIEIWKEPQFTEKQAELLNLMKNREFKICFEHKDGYYLAPQLFSDEKKDYHWRTNENNLVFRYNYKFMPKGILSQLIVMLNKYISNDIFWKYGVLFEYKNSRAIVTENRFKNENIITIRVEGDERFTLLSIIGSNVEEINSSYTNLDVSEEFGCCCNECKSSEKPYYWKLKTINRAINKGKNKVECQKSFEDVEISDLLGNYVPIEHLSRLGKERGDMEKIYVGISSLNRNMKDGFEEIHSHLYYQDTEIIEMKFIVQQLEISGKEIMSQLKERGKDINRIEQIIENINNKNEQTIIEVGQNILGHINWAFDEYGEEFNESMKETITNLNKSDNWQTKIKFSVPLLNLIGVNIEHEVKLNKYLKWIYNTF